MYFIGFFGLLMITLSTIMIFAPHYWANGIVKFSQKLYFHWFEVISRIIAGCVFVLYSKTTQQPLLISALGYIFISVGVGLLIIGSLKHRQFAVWSAHKFKPVFRLAGCGSFIFGIYVIYISIGF